MLHVLRAMLFCFLLLLQPLVLGVNDDYKAIDILRELPKKRPRLETIETILSEYPIRGEKIIALIEARLEEVENRYENDIRARQQAFDEKIIELENREKEALAKLQLFWEESSAYQQKKELELQEAQKVVGVFQSQSSEWNQLQTVYQNWITSRETDINKINDEYVNLFNYMSFMHGEGVALFAEKEQLSIQLNAEKEQSQKYRESYETLLMEHQTSLQNLQVSLDRAGILEQQLEAVTKNCLKNENELQTLKGSYETMSIEHRLDLQVARDRLIGAEEDLEVLKSDYVILENELKNGTIQRVVQEDYSAILENELKNSKFEVTRLLSELAENQAEIQSKESNWNLESAKFDSLKVKLEEKIGNLQKKLNESTSQIKDLKLELSSSCQKKTKLTDLEPFESPQIVDRGNLKLALESCRNETKILNSELERFHAYNESIWSEFTQAESNYKCIIDRINNDTLVLTGIIADLRKNSNSLANPYQSEKSTFVAPIDKKDVIIIAMAIVLGLPCIILIVTLVHLSRQKKRKRENSDFVSDTLISL